MQASATVLLETIDWAGLPEDVREDIRLLGPHIADGFATHADLARRTGLPTCAVKARLDRIRDALTLSAFDHIDDLDSAAQERLLVEVDRLTKPR